MADAVDMAQAIESEHLAHAVAAVRKPRLSAAVLRAARADDREFGAFLTHLIEQGLAVHLQQAER